MKKLVIIDDDTVSVLILKKMLFNAGFSEIPLVFNNGNEAILFLNNHYNLNEEYYVFLDINMPIMNGWEFLENIKERIPPKNFKVYLLSSSTNEEEKNKSKDYSFIKKFISKPITKELLNEIKEAFYKS